MAGLLDSLLLNLDRQTAPEQRPFSLQNFMTDAGQMGNVLAKNEERQRQNSLRRLIEQRESEGFGYDQLSNEAAKYDMDAANSMRREFRDSYHFNQKQSDVELQRYKREMADYWFGEVLRRAGQAGLGPEQLKYITYQAASMIAPYDSDLAYKLLRDSEMAQANDNKLEAAANKPQKPQKDHTDQFNANRKKYSEAAQDFDKNPKQYRENRMMMLVDDAIRAWKYRSPEKGEQYAHLGGYSRAIWTPMETALAEEVKRRFPKYNVSVSQYNAAEKWLRGLKDEDFNNIPGFMETVVENEFNNNEPAQAPIAQKNNVGNASAPVVSAPQEGSGGVELPKSLITWNGDTSSERVDDEAVAELNASIPELTTKDDFRNAFKLASQLSGIESGENAAYKDVKARIDKRRDEVDEEIDLLKEMGVRDPEKQFDDFRKIFGTRASMGFIRQINNLNSFVDGYYSNSPMTVIVNGLLFGEPNYKPTTEEFNQAKQIHGDTWQNIKTQVANFKIPVMSKIADFDNQQQALYSTGRAVQRQAKSLWQGLTKGMSEEEKAKMDTFLRNNLRIGDDAMDILKGKARLAFNDEEYNRIRDNLNKADESGDLRLIGGDSDTDIGSDISEEEFAK